MSITSHIYLSFFWWIFKIYFFFFFFFLVFLGLHLRHVEVPRLEVKLELQLPVLATAVQNLSHVHDLHHSSQQSQILKALSKARHQICVLMDASQICFRWAMIGTPKLFLMKGASTFAHDYSYKFLLSLDFCLMSKTITICYLLSLPEFDDSFSFIPQQYDPPQSTSLFFFFSF